MIVETKRTQAFLWILNVSNKGIYRCTLLRNLDRPSQKRFFLSSFLLRRELCHMKREKPTPSRKSILCSVPAKTEKCLPVLLSHILYLLHLIYYQVFPSHFHKCCVAFEQLLVGSDTNIEAVGFHPFLRKRKERMRQKSSGKTLKYLTAGYFFIKKDTTTQHILKERLGLWIIVSSESRWSIASIAQCQRVQKMPLKI